VPYYTIDDNGKRVEMPVEFKRSADYKKYYAHGAQGGILSSYHYRIDFYCEHIPPFEGTEIGRELKTEQHIIREIDCSVYLSLPFAKQLRDWLDKNIRDFEDNHGEIKIVAEIGSKKTI
jgi:hypothetical protein